MRHRFLAALAALFFVLAVAPAAAQQEDTRLLRFPHIHGDRVVFTYAGDLYTAPVRGGQATRLTSHEGLEIFAKFSPDGRWIAFSGEYAGTRQVYVIPSSGGEPRQLTFYPDVGPMPPRGGYDHLIMDWTPDGEHILVRANRTPFGQRVGRYYLVDPDGGLEVPLEIPEGGSGATYDPTGTKLAYTIKSREWRHWKRYTGGRQQEVWLYDLDASTSQRITDFTGTDHFPMWVGDAVYFVSDRGESQKLNLWRYDLDTEQFSQVTSHEDFDVLWPSRGQGGIVYQSGGWIWHYDPEAGSTRKLSITVPGDRPYALPYWKQVGDDVESYDLSPSGNRAVFGARGEVFTVPAEHGNTRNLSETPGERERSVAWSPDGRWLAYLSDATGAYELYVRAADGSGEPRQLTSGGESWIYGMEWSPSSEWIAWSDQRNRLRAVEVSTGAIREVDRTTGGRLFDYDWAPDSRWLTYSKTSANTMSAVWLYSFESDRATKVTGDMTDESSPVFDRQGRYLYFVSARDFDYGDRGFDARIFVATLQADGPHPFPPRSDEEPAIADGDDGSGDDEEASSSETPVRIDLDGLGDRIMALPDVQPGSYFGLTGTDSGLLYFSNGTVHLYSLDDRSAKPVVEGVQGYVVNADRSKLMFRNRDDYGIVDLQPGQSTDDVLSLRGMELRIDPRVEWAQIYHDAWRIMSDWFYDPGMHGVDWPAMYEKYRPLVDHLAHRTDLDFILAELIAELNVGHAYVNSSPEMPGPDRVPVALLGAELRADGDRYRIANIFPGENWHENFRSPLTEPGIDVREGDFLIAIDGEEVTTADNPYRLLVNKLDRIVRVTVSANADGSSARTYEVDPVESELGLRYQEWVAENAALVDSLSGGRIGYIHLPNTAFDGHRELYEGFRPLHRKEALILDDRYNGGGFIPEEMALMLDRPILNYWSRRNIDLYSQPGIVHTGPKATLINGQASSGGDAFPYYFRELGLGPLIGTRTWGGLVGISGNPGFVDGGSIAIPAFAFVNEDGEWAVEGQGVEPDIEVIDRPEEIAAGREPIIERAVEYLLRQLEEQEQYERPETPVGPDRGPPGG